MNTPCRSRRLRRLLPHLLGWLQVIALCACGQTGPLYQPQPEPREEAAQDDSLEPGA